MKLLVVVIIVAVTSLVAFGASAPGAPHSIQRTFEWGAPATVPGVVE